jgi:hypothetical protein
MRRFSGSADSIPNIQSRRYTVLLYFYSLTHLSPLSHLPWSSYLGLVHLPLMPSISCPVASPFSHPTLLTPSLSGPLPHSTMVGAGVHSWFKVKVKMSYFMSYREASRRNITVRGMEDVHNARFCGVKLLHVLDGIHARGQTCCFLTSNVQLLFF